MTCKMINILGYKTIFFTKIKQVLLNLALNAKKAMRRRGGQLRIGGRVEGGSVVIEVADTGAGIAPQVMPRLFEPFVTHTPADTAEGESTDVAPRGTGLGLCICRDLLRNAGGTIRADSTSGKGATFTLTVPLAPDILETT